MQMENNCKKIIIKISSQRGSVIEITLRFLLCSSRMALAKKKTNKSPIIVGTGHKVVVTNPDTLINHKWVPQKVYY